MSATTEEKSAKAKLGRKPVPDNETPRDRFVRLGTARTTAVLNSLNTLGNCADATMYEYTDDDVAKIETAVLAKAGAVIRALKARKVSKESFSL